MTRGTIKTEVAGRLFRTVAQTPDIDTWFQRVIERVENIYPLHYTKTTVTKVLTPTEQLMYDLPPLLITHQPFVLMLESFTEDDVFTPVIKMDDREMKLKFTQPKQAPGTPKYLALVGSATGDDFQLYPVPDKAQDLDFYGHYHTDFTGISDSFTNHLTDRYADLLIEGMVELGAEYYGEYDKSDRARQKYMAYLNGDVQVGVSGLIQDEKKRERSGRRVKVKFAYDRPNAIPSRLLLEK